MAKTGKKMPENGVFSGFGWIADDLSGYFLSVVLMAFTLLVCLIKECGTYL